MEFGVVLQTDPPAHRFIELMRRAETAGFSNGWTFDSVVLWQEPFVILSSVLEHTSHLKVGTMVTNPVTRDWTVTASAFATLNDMYGNRTVCGIGRGDSAVRVIGSSPQNLTTLEQAMVAIKDLAEGRETVLNNTAVRFPWVDHGQLPIWMGAYGPKALELAGRVSDGLILQIADPYLVEWMIHSVRTAARNAGRDPDGLSVCVSAPAYVSADLAHAREQCRWFGGMVGNHVAELVRRYGAESRQIPSALTEYVEQRPDYDYAHHGRSGNPSTDFVSDDVVDRFCIIGPESAHIEKLRQLADLGVHHFAIYDMHDAVEATIDVYGETIIPALH